MVNQLAVLLWKHFVVRRRRFIHTPIEWLSPIIFFVVLFVFRNQINPIPKHAPASMGVHYTEPLNIEEIYQPGIVFFTPITDVTSKLMVEVGKKLNLPKGSGQPKENINRGYFPILDDPFVIKRTVHGMTNFGVVIFENIKEEDTALPDKLNYTIRMSLPYDSLENDNSDAVGFHSGFGERYEPFVRLQWAVDSSFLELKTNKNIKQRVSLQEFPYATSAKYPNVDMLTTLLMYLTWLSLLLPFVFLSSRLLGERVSGIREMIYMVGVPSGLLHLSHFINAAPAGLVFSVVGASLLTVGYNPLLRFTNPFLIWLLLVLYFIKVIAIAYVTSGMLKKSLGLTFSNMARTQAPYTASALSCYLLLMLQSLVFGLLAWYLGRVSPGPYGQAMPWNFCLQREFWGKKVVPEDALEESEPADTQDPLYFEPATHMRQDGGGIRIVNVTKVFPKHKALSNVSLNIASGEITVLLGHNGAGKTTLMSIITGMLSPSEGSVYIEGLDASRDRDAVRKQLGLCPQHNLFFSDLTVLEHVMFYTLLKGRSYGSARKSSMALLEQLGLGGKAHASAGALSGGMKRRLQLACALAGDARVLVLDEPTSGLDVETRRGLWDLLLSLRGSRVVLISTHFMEEADALGDRVAALQAGRLKCFASPMHLKRALGTGYRLTCQTVGEPREDAITSLVTSRVAGATLRERTLNSVSYALPAEQTHAFPKLFQELESRRSELQVDTIGVGASTLEEVFLKLCSDAADVSFLDEIDADTGPSATPEYTGMKLYARQFCALFLRHFQYIAAHKMSFFVLQVFLPIGIIVSVTFGSNNYNAKPTNYSVPMDLDFYSNMDRKILLNVDPASVKLVESWYPGVKVTPSKNVTEDILRIGKRDIMDYNKYLVGLEINDTDAKLLYTTVRHHAAPVAASLLANTLGAALGAGAITTNNQPIKSEPVVNTFRSKDLDSLFLWASMVVFVMMTTIINAVTLPCKERVSGARHLQVLAGARAPLPWLAALAAHTLTYSTLLAASVLVAAATIDTDHTIDQPDFLGVLFLSLLAGIMAFLALCYLVSFWFGERGAGGVLIAAVIVFGFITPTVYTVMDLMQTFTPDDPRGWLYYVVMTIGYLMPPHQFTTAVMRSTYVASTNAVAALRPQSGVEGTCYLCFDEYAPGATILILFGHLIAYMTLVILMEYGVFGVVMERMASARYTEPVTRDADDVVRGEAEYVRKAIDLPKDKITDALLAYNLHKSYTKVLGKSVNAVKGVSFSVKKGEVFGLLGVNGAGKTTIFKMLTGLERPTLGRVFAVGHHQDRARHRYLRALGYCPQFGGLDEFLSCGANLRLLLALRGLSPTAAARDADAWLSGVGLQRFASRRVSALSGGCARRLAAAAALCGGGRLLLLDEPSAGVDVSARRLLWAALLRAAARAAVVVSSHSMDETEALCGRIAIVAGGRVRALGSAAALRAQHAAGYALVLRVTPSKDVDETDSSGGAADVSTLKSKLHQTFNCTLKDEHKTMLHYHIDEALPYSELFARLESVRASYPLLQDYAVAETTLEEVFLSFARDQTDDAAQPTPV
ncbi:ATP-binding cassette sub-family A member 17-like isoform X2 [Aricia agestis]|uniref:ATP-binding cassette sub-family A member 17-like isoform X2 n=1 Tax=Aricia agestis TaxID=91739 RepID=UPI001C20753A|nr:ATP-binding cassette sub-family A member 17-like isoform X2 [Aricia agestis]